MAIIKDLSFLVGKKVGIGVNIAASGMALGVNHKGTVVDVIDNAINDSSFGCFILLDNGEMINTRYIVLLKVYE